MIKNVSYSQVLPFSVVHKGICSQLLYQIILFMTLIFIHKKKYILNHPLFVIRDCRRKRFIKKLYDIENI